MKCVYRQFFFRFLQLKLLLYIFTNIIICRHKTLVLPNGALSHLP